MHYIKDSSNIPNHIFENLQKIKHVVLDLDGTIYAGNTLFPYTIGFLDTLLNLGVGFSFLTNNSSMGKSEHLLKLRTIGLNVSEEDLVTSVDATLHFIKSHHPLWRRLFLLGTPSLITQFEKSGFIILDENSNEEPDALIVSFDTSLKYDRLCRAAWWAKQGKPYFSTNPDLMCPTDQDVVLVDCGAICLCIEAATGRKPDKVLGKPHTDILTGIITSKKVQTDQVAIVGDRIYTDMMTAHNSGSMGILVLSGEAVLPEVNVDASSPKFDLIVPSIKELGELLVVVNKKL